MPEAPSGCGRRAGDVNSITVGDNTNLQDGVVVHVARTALGSPAPTIIGHNVTVGAQLHAAPRAPVPPVRAESLRSDQKGCAEISYCRRFKEVRDHQDWHCRASAALAYLTGREFGI